MKTKKNQNITKKKLNHKKEVCNEKIQKQNQNPKKINTIKKQIKIKEKEKETKAKNNKKTKAKKVSKKNKSSNKKDNKKEKTIDDKKNKGNKNVNQNIKQNFNKNKTFVSNGEVALDAAVEDVDRYIVVAAKPSEYEDKYYSVTMNYTNVKNNNNKFYIIQMLQDKNTKEYGVLFRWGRVGRFGQVNYIIYKSYEEARLSYLTKLQKKLEYGYIKIKTKVEAKSREEEELDKGNDEGLEKPLANLIRLVFDLKSVNEQMKTIGYDSDRIPLGQLSLDVIKEGYKYLNQLDQIINNNDSNKSNKICDLSSKYYTIIPHNFGMYHMSNFVINNSDKIRQEIELLESIKNIKVLTGLYNNKNIKNDNLESENKSKDIRNSLKEKIKELNYEFKYIPKEEPIYSLIEKYLLNSNEMKNSPKIALNEVFEVTKKNEKKNISNEISLGNKKLLWHGVSIPNFVSLFKNGFELPSSEAPIFSYMFGKGIYFSDIAIKAFYNSLPQNKIGLMLLCEVSLGNIEERFKADIKLPSTLNKDSNSVKILGMNFPVETNNFIDNDSVIIPLGKIVQNKDENKKTIFEFNEYIVYNLDQIKIKYIVKAHYDT